MKIDPPLVILIVTVFAAAAAYYSNVQSNKQFDRMENYDSLNLRLGNEIKQLSDINNSIAGQIDTIVRENKSLTEQNIILTNKANELIKEVNKLSVLSNDLISKVNIRTEKQSIDNALTGEINLENPSPLRNNETLTVRVGGMTLGNSVERYKSSTPPGNIVIGDKDLVPLRVINNVLKISATVYDLDGKLIAEIEDNNWIRNPNNTGKFNYDSKGFEIIDNRGFTALSINLDTRTHISIEGYFLDIKTGNLFINGDKSFRLSINYPPKTIIELIEKANIRKLFIYSGQDWNGKRNNTP